MDKRTKLGIGGAAAVVAIGAGSFLGIAAATGGDDQPLQGDAKDQGGRRGAGEHRRRHGHRDRDRRRRGRLRGRGEEGGRLAGGGAAGRRLPRHRQRGQTTTARAARTTISRTSPAGAGVGESARADHLRHGPQEPGPRLDRLGHRLRQVEGAARAG